MTLSRAFALQARSDFEVYSLLNDLSLPSCHRLHYLQMWLEKLCKAFLSLDPECVHADLYTHNVIAKVLPGLTRSAFARQSPTRVGHFKNVQRMCRQIDLLHPQITAGGRHKENVEYPWEQPDGVYNLPSRTRFTVAHDLHSSSGRAMLAAALAATVELSSREGSEEKSD